MNISEVKVKLTEQDILSIINEFVNIEGLKLEKVTVQDGITLEGSFHKGITINFLAKAEIVKCENNKIFVRLAKVKILKLGILRILRSFVLKQLTKICEQFGITNEKEVAIIDINKVLRDVPYININVDDIYIKKNEVYAEVNNVEVSVAGTLIKNTEAEEVQEEEKDIDLDNIVKVKDNYSKGRDILINKIPENRKKFSDYIFVLPDIITLIYRLLKDKRVPARTKVAVSAAIAYITVPTDMIPDKIPLIGKIDDMAVVFFALNRMVNDVPLEVIVENWEGNNDILLALTSGLDYLTNFTNAKNVESLYSIVSELSSL
jgi:uncharacterized membrane protein YkvA (DUF1232 family)